jgi:RimJ/RimL family protein N-acetyltransferase
METHGSIDGHKVRLERFRETYITEEYLEWLRDEDVNRYLVKPNSEITMKEVRTYCRGLMESEGNYFFAIVAKDEEKHIGNARLGPIIEISRLCRYGMMIGDKRYHRKGYASEVVSLCVKFAFETLGMHKVYLDVVENNVAATRLYEKCGFHTEGVLKDHIYLNGEYCDLRMMGIFNFREEQETS